MRDLRYAIRTLRATPLVTGVAVLSLALGIGGNTAIFSIVNGLLLRTLPVAEPQRLVTISSDFALGHGFKAGLGWSYPMWLQMQPRVGMFDGALAWFPADLDLARGGDMQPAKGVFVSGDFFRVLAVNAQAGRVLTTADDVRGGGPDGPVAVISDRMWRRRFNASTSVLGTRLSIGDVVFTIVGVTPPGFFGVEVGQAFDVAIPLESEPLVRGPRTALAQNGSYLLTVMLRLKATQSAEAATEMLRAVQAELHGLPPGQLARASPRFNREPFVLVPAGTGIADRSGLRRTYSRPVITMLVVAGLVLLVACVNIANLLLARAAARRHEFSVRLALGAPKTRIARQLLVESLVLAASGAAIGVLCAAWGMRALMAHLPGAGSGVFVDLSLDWRVLAFTAVVTIATALVSSVVPAIRVSRVAPIEALKEQGRGTAGESRLNVSGMLIVGQLAISLTLVFGAGLLVRTFDRLAHEPLGLNEQGLLVVTADTAQTGIDPSGRLALYNQLVEAVAGVPGVVHAAGSTLTPLSDASRAPLFQQPDAILNNAVTPRWFETYGIPIRAGRDFTTADTVGAPPVAVVNEAYVRKFFVDRGALGEMAGKRTIVGIAGDAVFGSVRDGMRPTVYVPLGQEASTTAPGRTHVSLTVRAASGSPISLARPVGAALTTVHPSVTFKAEPLTSAIEASLAQERILATLSGVFGLLALLLAALGLYGMVSYSVSRRRTEIGIRLALGTAPRAIVNHVLARVTILMSIGVILGALISLWVSRYIATLLYGLQPADPVTLLAAGALLGAVGALAGWIPARRASMIDPAEVLRNN